MQRSGVEAKSRPSLAPDKLPAPRGRVWNPVIEVRREKRRGGAGARVYVCSAASRRERGREMKVWVGGGANSSTPACLLPAFSIYLRVTSRVGAPRSLPPHGSSSTYASPPPSPLLPPSSPSLPRVSPPVSLTHTEVLLLAMQRLKR